MKSQEGRVRVLQNFRERSKLLRGIENYRVEILEANPGTFILPKHCDAEALFFVAKGRAAISLIREGKREAFNLQTGDILRVPAGAPFYMVNKDDHEKLCVAKLIQPVFTPGHYETFFGPGGEDPESFYNAFSIEILEAALKTEGDRLKRLFGQQKQGAIVKASKEQIQSMSHHEEGGSWPFGGESSRGPFNLLKMRPSQSNEYGRLHEANCNDYKQLQDLDVAVSFANITKGSMEAPFFNSKATKISLVIDGDGYYEMACPHLSSSQSGEQHYGGGGSEERQSGPRYQKVSAQLRRGVVFIVPAGHPVVAVASNNQNLQIVCFEINARGNERYPLAGKRNVINQFEREAKELAFNVPAREVEQVFQNNKQDFFFPGPRQQRQGRASA
ncbi:hypothetical protein L1049_004392 [Liquidambar formosana]|uniref:Cupin type-1 domain-containing protein n=1 Tax=Liquidambar formosana TaxID=63359 RepID=A0AAP0RN65_LIQFO